MTPDQFKSLPDREKDAWIAEKEAAFKEGAVAAFEEAGRMLSEPLKREMADDAETTCCDKRERYVLQKYSQKLWARSREVVWKSI